MMDPIQFFCPHCGESVLCDDRGIVRDDTQVAYPHGCYTRRNRGRIFSRGANAFTSAFNEVSQVETVFQKAGSDPSWELSAPMQGYFDQGLRDLEVYLGKWAECNHLFPPAEAA